MLQRHPNPPGRGVHGCPTGLRRRRRGFTLIEAALTTAIVGVGFLSMMQLFATCTAQNAMAADMTTAMGLASHVQETMAGLTLTDPAYGKTYFGIEPGQALSNFDDIDDFDNQTFSPPIDSNRQTITDLGQYSQVVSVWPVFERKLSVNTNPSNPDVSQLTYTGAARVTVRVLFKRNTNDVAKEVYRASWIRVE